MGGVERNMTLVLMVVGKVEKKSRLVSLTQLIIVFALQLSPLVSLAADVESAAAALIGREIYLDSESSYGLGWKVLGGGLLDGPITGSRSCQQCSMAQWINERSLPEKRCAKCSAGSYDWIAMDGKEVLVSTEKIAHDGRFGTFRVVDTIVVGGSVVWPHWSWRCQKIGQPNDGNSQIWGVVQGRRCDRYTTRVKRAWRFDLNTLKFIEIASHGLRCEQIDYEASQQFDYCPRSKKP